MAWTTYVPERGVRGKAPITEPIVYVTSSTIQFNSYASDLAGIQPGDKVVIKGDTDDSSHFAVFLRFSKENPESIYTLKLVKDSKKSKDSGEDINKDGWTQITGGIAAFLRRYKIAEGKYTLEMSPKGTIIECKFFEARKTREPSQEKRAEEIYQAGMSSSKNGASSSTSANISALKAIVDAENDTDEEEYQEEEEETPIEASRAAFARHAPNAQSQRTYEETLREAQTVRDGRHEVPTSAPPLRKNLASRVQSFRTRR